MNTTRPADAVKRFWWIVVLFTVGGAAVGGLPEPEQAVDAATRWRACHTMLVSGDSSAVIGLTDALSFSQLELFATTGLVPERAAESIDYPGAPAALAAEVEVLSDQQSGAVRVCTTQQNSENAVAYSDAIADELVTYLAERQDELRQDRLTSTLSRLEALETQVDEAQQQVIVDPDDRVAQSQADALSRQYSVVFEQFNVLQAEQGQLVLTTLERAQPVAISDSGLGAPRSRTSRAALGGAVGFALGIVVALVLARVDRRIRTRQQAEDAFELNVDATIPKVRKHAADELAVVDDNHDPLSDAYRTLRSIVGFLDSDNPNVVDRGAVTVIVSAGPGDGKTSTAANLTAAFVEAGSRTVAVNTDFRRPTLSERLGVNDPEPAGLDLGEIEHAPLELVLAPGDDPGLAVLDLSPMRDYSPGDLARVTAKLIPRLSAVADEVVIDTSPLGATAEALEFLPIADNVVVIARLGHTSYRSARRAIEIVRTLSTGNVMLVLVGDAGDSSGYYYRYHSVSEQQPNRIPRRRTQEQSISS